MTSLSLYLATFTTHQRPSPTAVELTAYSHKLASQTSAGPSQQKPPAIESPGPCKREPKSHRLPQTAEPPPPVPKRMGRGGTFCRPSPVDLRGSFLWLTPIKAGLSSSVSAHFKCQRCPDSGKGPNKSTYSDSIHSVHSVLRGLLPCSRYCDRFCVAQRRDACDESKCESLSLVVLLSILSSPGCDSPPPPSRQLVECIIILPTPNHRFASYERYNARNFNVIPSRYENCTIIRKSEKITRKKPCFTRGACKRAFPRRWASRSWCFAS